MTPEKIAELRALLAKATPGPWATKAPVTIRESWLVVVEEGRIVAECRNADMDRDSALIVALRNHAEELIEGCDELHRMLSIDDKAFNLVVARAECAEAELEKARAERDKLTLASEQFYRAVGTFQEENARLRAALERIADYPGSDGLGNDEPDSQSMAREALGEKP